MNVFLWIVAVLLAAVFPASGVVKLVRPKEKLVASGQAGLGGFSAGMVNTIAALEVLAAIGLVLPPTFGIALVLAPPAALGLVLLMLGAAIIHLRRKETSGIAVTLVLLALAAVMVWGRFGPQPFAA